MLQELNSLSPIGRLDKSSPYNYDIEKDKNQARKDGSLGEL